VSPVILERGQREGCIAEVLPAAVLSEALEAVTLGLVEAQNSSDWGDPHGEASTVTVLLAAGFVHRTRNSPRHPQQDGADFDAI